MQVTAHDAFMAMYYALEAATDEYTDQGLKTLVQDCNPFIWKDHLSADPAVWAEFSEAFVAKHDNNPVTPEQARIFCREWLDSQSERHEFYAGPLVAAFDSIATPDTWESAIAEL